MHSLSPLQANNTKATVDVQYASTQTTLPIQKEICTWVDTTLALITDIGDAHHKSQRKNGSFEVELTVRIVDEDEGIALNKRYRGQEMATNVLSFPCKAGATFDLNLLGDIVICAPVVKREIIMQHKKPYNAHWAHMIIHGALHLLGYDHQSTMEARYMEFMETAVLAQLGFSDPYRNP
uniref:Endoribonuclease YbeY n=1 Tax=Candidatus Kentrum sp. TC TaxID=2126339 RepID=A0A450Z6D8_9GAMM|nr:MAG: probable rRNA maturation factor [Candidatus Kentron sp. TC]VFK49353.1 MAG: probable rRNA maturation factor [Candidatus Kentron sp. TC]VFK53329.1 MAG: probable rRNA maturation factor [Candidatus Kentron sp. TC]